LGQDKNYSSFVETHGINISYKGNLDFLFFQEIVENNSVEMKEKEELLYMKTKFESILDAFGRF